MADAKLTVYINKHEWWRTALPDKQEIKARGVFFMNSFRGAEFYGRPLDTPFKVKVEKVLFGDERSIMKVLGLPPPSQDITAKERFALDSKMKQFAIKKGYDSIAIMSTKASERYRASGTIPRSIELNVFDEELTEPGARVEVDSRTGREW